MTFFPQPDRPEIDAFFIALARLTLPQWATIVTRFMGAQSRAADASDVVAEIVAGSDQGVSADERKGRLMAAHQAYDRVSMELSALPDSVYHDGAEVPLRGLVEMATFYVLQALVVKEAIVIRPHIWSALTHPFAGFVELDA